MKEKIVIKMEKVRMFVCRIIFTHAADCRRDNTTDCAAAPIVSALYKYTEIIIIKSYPILSNSHQL